MRRRSITALAGAAALIGFMSSTPGQAAALLCPPGCVVAGTVKAAGGLPDPSSISIQGRIDVIVSTVTGQVAGAVSTGGTYQVSISGPVSQDSAGNLSGRVSFLASRTSVAGDESFGDTVEVSGTAARLALSGPRVSAVLSEVGSRYEGSVLYAQTHVPSVEVPEDGTSLSKQCLKSSAVVEANAPQSDTVTSALRQLKAVCRALR